VLKDFFAAIGCGDKQGLLVVLPKILSGSFRGEDWRWQHAPAGTRDWRMFQRIRER